MPPDDEGEAVTTQELHDAIFADATAKALADAGNDVACAARMVAILPPVVQAVSADNLLIWGEGNGVLAAVEAFIATFTFAGATTQQYAIYGICKAVDYALTSNSPLDITNPRILAGLDALTAATILPVNTATAPATTPGSKADLLAYGSVPQVVTHGQVSDAWLQYREGNIVGGGA